MSLLRKMHTLTRNMALRALCSLFYDPTYLYGKFLDESSEIK